MIKVLSNGSFPRSCAKSRRSGIGPASVVTSRCANKCWTSASDRSGRSTCSMATTASSHFWPFRLFT